jgi:hypothetical protein
VKLGDPFAAGGVKLTKACALPATAVTPVGAAGVFSTANDRVTVAAAGCVSVAASLALIVQVPIVTNVSRPPEVTVQTGAVLELNVTVPAVVLAVNVGEVASF